MTSASDVTLWYSLLIDHALTYQAYYAYRIHILSGKLFLPIVSWTGSTLHFVCALIEVVFEYDPSIGENASRQFRWSEYTTLAFDIVVDTINTAGLSVFLYRQKRQNELPRYISSEMPYGHNIKTNLYLSSEQETLSTSSLCGQ